MRRPGSVITTLFEMNGPLLVGLLCMLFLLSGCEEMSLLATVKERVENPPNVDLESVEKPVFSIESGTYSEDQQVEIICLTGGADIRYTTDGSEPTENSTKYTGPVSVAGDGTSMTIKAVGTKSGMDMSDTAELDISINYFMVSTPSFDVDSGTYTNDFTVQIFCTTDGATIAYTTDGTDPFSSGTAVRGTAGSSEADVAVNSTMELRAVAEKDGMSPSTERTASYTMQVLDPEFSPGPGSYGSSIDVSISSATGGMTIHYETDTNAPDPSEGSGTLYSGAVSLDTGLATTIRAMAFREGYTSSQVVSADYTFDLSDPDTLSATQKTTDEIHISWNDNSSNETGFEIERKQEGADWSSSTSFTVGPEVTSYTDGDAALVDHTTYTYRVRAVNDFYESNWTNEASASLEWHIEEVDEQDAYTRSAVVVDHTTDPDTVHVAYTSVSRYIKYAKWDGTSWTIETVDVPPAWHQLEGADIVLDNLGRPHISYLDLDEGIKYAKWDGTSWTVETVYYFEEGWQSSGISTAIDIDTSTATDTLYIACAVMNYDEYGAVKLAVGNAGSWDIREVERDEGSVEITETTIAMSLDGNGFPNLAYRIELPVGLTTFGDARYAQWDDENKVWLKSRILDNDFTYVREDLSLAYLGTDTPSIVFIHDNTMKHAQRSGTDWTIEAIPDTEQSSISGMAHVVTAGGEIHLVHERNEELWYSYYNSSTWSAEAVETLRTVGRYTSLAIDGAGVPHIFYNDDENERLMYAYPLP